jgi:sugar lactone lactonase YvrE
MGHSSILPALLAWLAAGSVAAAPAAPLQLEARIPLGAVKGRIDHLAVDLKRRRLFVAELGNDSVGVVDLAAGKAAAPIGGQHEPQGMAFRAADDLLYVAGGVDGVLRRYRGADLAPAGSIRVGDDPDNVRIDPRTGQVLVGYGSGAIAFIDPAAARVTGEVRLKSHPESFRFSPSGDRIHVNLARRGEVAEIDAGSRTLVGSWPVRAGFANFPMAVEPDGRVLIVTRLPARLIALDAKDGRITAQAGACGDSDDLFFDARRGRIYVSCGDGHIDVFADRGASLERLTSIPTVPGARTSLFVPELDRLYLAVRANGREPAAIWVFRPQP